MARSGFPVLLILLAFVPAVTWAQDADTINIYPDSSGMGFKHYYRYWFPREGMFTYEPAKVNAQDSLIMSSDAHYFKIHDKKGRLKFEGFKDPTYNGCLTGPVRFYYPDGSLRRVENYGMKARTADNRWVKTPYDGPARVGLWKYYTRSGRLQREREYHYAKGVKPFAWRYERTDRRFNKDGEVKKEHSTPIFATDQEL